MSRHEITCSGYQSRKVECLSMTEIENRTAGDLFCEGPRPSDLRKCSIQCPQKQCVLSPWSQWVNEIILTYIMLILKLPL